MIYNNNKFIVSDIFKNNEKHNWYTQSKYKGSSIEIFCSTSCIFLNLVAVLLHKKIKKYNYILYDALNK